jgi:hypothetical protein
MLCAERTSVRTLRYWACAMVRPKQAQTGKRAALLYTLSPISLLSIAPKTYSILRQKFPLALPDVASPCRLPASLRLTTAVIPHRAPIPCHAALLLARRSHGVHLATTTLAPSGEGHRHRDIFSRGRPKTPR